MVRLNQLMAAGVLSLLVMTGCSNTNQPTATDTSTTPTATDVSSKTAQTKPATDKDTTKVDSKTETKPTTEVKTESKTKASATEKVDVKAGVASLQETLSSLKKSLESGKAEAAKTDLEKFKETWSKLEGEIKTKSDSNYKEIKTAADEVATNLKADKPDTAKISAAVDNLSKSLDSYAKTLK